MKFVAVFVLVSAAAGFFVFFAPDWIGAQGESGAGR
ncbi:MAG: hypothetical protein UY45_C0005G0033 [Parcubacteria group bacterium GW2011_GWA1_49_26]|uniref:Uncharacterized protein n=2 Tax=Parcubacteria group TaxID=1794811 RepID=A0A0G1XE16_9BACT|nr:MAG: hypothetical protein UY25_C0004G0127 [Candidatus Yanofskybacteria bacterium GW2011_GWC1_48_11]KKW04440.1 MAG: hypothetical protein UY38_C0001G0007 [Parcubacteria group bacterium GW2011_GWB1_49_12]KKW08630.1 MAG: hypothetical protein UY45_C0005G0033 [Parcubacteria group bacterium GW2011_GWA1_49_26]KKW29528.1 MAG: hypothetical protein UY74_C0072G0006 [Candidatus Kaiserbacteria bacterium GW2011_GWC2_52_8b]